MCCVRNFIFIIALIVYDFLKASRLCREVLIIALFMGCCTYPNIPWSSWKTKELLPARGVQPVCINGLSPGPYCPV